MKLRTAQSLLKKGGLTLLHQQEMEQIVGKPTPFLQKGISTGIHIDAFSNSTHGFLG